MPSRGIATGLPIGVRVPGIIALVLVAVMTGTMIVSASGIGRGGEMDHGPGGPMPAGDTGGPTPPSDMPESHTPPGGGH